MKNMIVVFFVLLVSTGALAGSPLLISERIDAGLVIEGMPLTNHKILKSGNGRKKQLWSIKGHEISTVEIIGKNQADADQVGMHCAVFDKQGNRISPVPADSPCHRIFVKLLSKFTTTPDAFARRLIEESSRSGITESRRLGDLSLEADGEFYMIRRWSRIGLR